MHSFSMRPSKYFYDKPLPKYLDPKTVLIYRPHPVFINNMCLANYGASEAVYPCNVVKKIHEYFRSKMRQCL